MVSAVYVKIIGQLLLSLLILYVAFGDEGVVSNTALYFSQLEPIMMQNFLVSSLTVGAEAPGVFSSAFETSGSPHKIIVTTEDDIKYLKVEPAKSVALKAKYKEHKRAELSLGNCILEDKIILLATKAQTVTVSKIISSTGKCLLDMDAD